MSLAPFKKVFFFCAPGQEDKFVLLLQQSSLVQLTDPEKMLSSTEIAFLQESHDSNIREKLSILEQRATQVTTLINRLEILQPKKNLLSHFAIQKEITTQKNFETVRSYDEFTLLETVRKIDNASHQLEKKIRQNTHLIKQLLLFKSVQIPLEQFRESKKTFTSFLLAPFERDNMILQKISDFLGEESHIQELHKSKDQRVLLVIGRIEKQSDFLQWSVNNQLINLNFQGLNGTAAQVIDQLQQEIVESKKALDQLNDELKKLTKELPRLHKLFDFLQNENDRLKKISLMKQSRFTRFISGWIPTKNIPLLETEIERNQLPIGWVTQEITPQDKPPVEYQNHPKVQPFEFVTDLYSRPKYWELDPTPFLSAFFALFFGICLTDAGYGIIVTLVTWLGLKKLSGLSTNSRKLLKIIFYSGIVTTLVGIFTGGIFGITFEELPGQLKYLHKLVLLNPLKNQMGFLIFTLALGILHVSFGIFLKMYSNLRQHQKSEAWLDHAPWLGILLAVVVLAVASNVHIWWLSKFGYLLMAIAALIILLFGGRSAKNPFARLGLGFYSLYQVSGLLGDVLSYVRLFALGLATGVIAGVVNFLAKLVLGIPYLGYVLMPLILIGGHLMNIVINALGGFIHTSRLQFVEFFGKFFEGGGEPFEPFRQNFKYTKIIDGE